MANSDYTTYSGGPFGPHAILAAGLSWLDTTVTFRGLNNPRFEPLAAGEAVLIGNEIMMVTSISGSTMTVKRGCSDTTPRQHVEDEDIWWLGTTNSNEKEYVGGDQVGVKVLPFLPAGRALDIEMAEPKGLTFNYRAIRPYPPGQMRVSGSRWYEAVVLSGDEPALSFTWVHRNRIIQADQLVGHEDASVIPEEHQHYLFQVRNGAGTVVRTETGLLGEAAQYTWEQAMADFGLVVDPVGNLTPGTIYFASSRDGYDSWTGYDIPFFVNNKMVYLFVAQVAQQTAQVNDEVQLPGMFAAQVAQQTAQADDLPTTRTVLVSSANELVSQLHSAATPLTRAVFESPYTQLLRRNLDPLAKRVTTAAARPSDRLTDAHLIYGRNRNTLPFDEVDHPPFTPWVTIDEDASHLATSLRVRKSSLYDGVPLTNVTVGQMAAINGEIVRVAEIASTHVRIARGCVDTVPAYHRAGSRIWFFEAANGFNRPDQSWAVDDTIGTKVVPAVYGPKLDPARMPTDTTKIANRVMRPFPPGEMLANGQPWFRGVVMRPDMVVTFTWVQRNRLVQAKQVIDHHWQNIAHEPGTKYRLQIAIRRDNTRIVIREAIVEGTTWAYGYQEAKVDGLRASSLLGACGYVIVPLYIDAIRDGLTNWQGYSIPLQLPGPPCPINKPPGGGQGPNSDNPGQGPNNGQNGGDNGNNENDRDNEVPNTDDDNDDGPPPPPPPPPPTPVPPPTWPPVPPDPIDPQQPGEPDPEDTGEHWDYTWDIHWDAYRRHGDNNQGEG